MFKKVSAALALAICGVMYGRGRVRARRPRSRRGQGTQAAAARRFCSSTRLRDVAAKYLDVDAAVAAGYVDIGLFVPNMGWHYMKESLVDEKFEWTRPELLVYADDPCGGKRRLVAVEYAVPLALSKKAPAGFVGRADQWDANQTFQLWTLHAWVYEFNPDGVFAPFNKRII